MRYPLEDESPNQLLCSSIPESSNSISMDIECDMEKHSNSNAVDTTLTNSIDNLEHETFNSITQKDDNCKDLGKGHQKKYQLFCSRQKSENENKKLKKFSLFSPLPSYSKFNQTDSKSNFLIEGEDKLISEQEQENVNSKYLFSFDKEETCSKAEDTLLANNEYQSRLNTHNSKFISQSEDKNCINKAKSNRSINELDFSSIPGCSKDPDISLRINNTKTSSNFSYPLVQTNNLNSNPDNVLIQEIDKGNDQQNSSPIVPINQPGPHSLFLGRKSKISNYASKSLPPNNANYDLVSCSQPRNTNQSKTHANQNSSISNRSFNNQPVGSGINSSGDCRSIQPQASQSRSSSLKHHLLQMYDSDDDSEAIVKTDGNEARPHSGNLEANVSPIPSPSTPGDACLVSSSTGHLDSIPPTPTNFQGNDASCPASPESSHAADGNFILDSTIDSTSGQIVNCTEDIDFSSRNSPEMSTSPVNLHEGDEVRLLMEHSDVFNNRNNDSRFIDQLNLSLNNFAQVSIEGSLSDNENVNNIEDHPSTSAFIDNDVSLAVSNDDTLSHPSTSYQSPNQITSNRLSLPAEAGPSSNVTSADSLGSMSLLGVCSRDRTIRINMQGDNVGEATHNIDNEEFEGLASNKMLNQFDAGYTMHRPRSTGGHSSCSEENMIADIVKNDSQDCNQLINHRQVCNQFNDNQNSLDEGSNLIEVSNLKNSIELSLSSHQLDENLIRNQQPENNLPPTRILEEQNNIVPSCSTSIPSPSNVLQGTSNQVRFLNGLIYFES